MSGMREIEVLVIGAGPAGTAAAAELAALGRQVLIVEAAPGPRDRVCGEFVSSESLPQLRKLGALDQLLNLDLPELRRARAHSSSRRASK